jgi:hypothetical protein
MVKVARTYTPQELIDESVHMKTKANAMDGARPIEVTREAPGAVHPGSPELDRDVRVRRERNVSEKSMAESWRDFEEAWKNFVLCYARSLKADRFVDWLAKWLSRLARKSR